MMDPQANDLLSKPIILGKNLNRFQLEQPQNHSPILAKSVSRNGLTPEENQSPSGVGVTRDLMASTIETAVDAAEDLPHFWISTPPLCKLIC